MYKPWLRRGVLTVALNRAATKLILGRGSSPAPVEGLVIFMLNLKQKRKVRNICSDLLRDKTRSKSAMTKAGRALTQPRKYRREKPYTEIGIKRLTCHRKGCDNKATRQWQICSDGNTYRPICDECDIALNKLVLEFMGFDAKEDMLEEYRSSLIR